MRTILLSLVFALFARTASADWTNPYSGIRWNNPMSSLADTMLHNNMNKMMLDAALKKSQGGAAPAPTPAQPVAHASYDKTDFAPANKRLVVDQIIAGLAQTPDQRQGLSQGMVAVFDAYEKSVRKNNVAYAVTFMVAASLQVQTGQQVDDAQSEQLAQAFNDVLANNPAFVKASASDRQKLYETCVTFGGLVVLFNEVGKKDPASANAAKALAKQALAMIGIK